MSLGFNLIRFRFNSKEQTPNFVVSEDIALKEGQEKYVAIAEAYSSFLKSTISFFQAGSPVCPAAPALTMP